MRELQTVSHRELMEPVVEIAQTGVPCGLPGQSQRMEPGFVLKNGTVLLESEKDGRGLYIGGAGMTACICGPRNGMSPSGTMEAASWHFAGYSLPPCWRSWPRRASPV